MTADLVTVTLHVADVAAELTIHALSGAEGMSALYAFDLDVTSGSAAIDLDAAVGKPAAITFAHGDRRRVVHGMVSAFEQDETDEQHLTRYHVRVVPRAWLLSQGSRSRIFSGLTSGEVIERVLGDAGIPHRKSLQGASIPKEMRVQYQESDWSFLCRIMEEEGIFYFFEHDEDGCTLVVADHASAHEPMGAPRELHFAGHAHDPQVGEAVVRFRRGSAILPGKVTTLDVPFDTPTRAVTEEAEHARDADVSIFSYGAGPRAQSRLDAITAGRDVGRGAARCVRLAPGATFRLGGHPRPSFDGGYLVTRVEHELTRRAYDEPQAYRPRFECVAEGVVARPQPRTPRPRIVGPQAARVTGPAGAAIHVDERGRVQVELEWDLAAEPCWAPVAQIASGAGFGAMVIPRVGSYVLVEFLDGDPDRPIVTGRVFNSVSPYPYPLPAERTKTALRTETTPGGGGHNELRFEDQEGREQLYLRAQRDLDVEALHDATRKVGRNDALQVQGDRSAAVQGAEATVIGLARTVSVGAAEALAVAGDRTLSVGGDRRASVEGDAADSVGGDRTEETAGAWTVTVGADGRQQIGGGRTIEVGGDAVARIEGSELHEVGGNQSVAVSGNLQQVVDGNAFYTHGALSVSVSGATAVLGSDEVKVESGTAVKIGGPYVYLSGDSTIHVRAYDKIVLEVASSSDADDGDSSKIEITRDGVYLTNGTVTKNLVGSKIHFNT